MKKQRFLRPDALSILLLLLTWLFLILGGILHSWVLLFLALAPMVLLTVRLVCPSPRRKRENEIFLSVLRAPATWIERRRYVFHSCPLCGARLRFPRKEGSHRAHCPACDGRFPITITKEKKP